MIRFDHCYTPDPGHQFHRSLGNRGFSLSPEETEHPGHKRCRFIRVAGWGDRTGPQNLEFVSAPQGAEFPPGLSFGTSGLLEAHFRRIETRSPLGPRLMHRNYDWKTSRHARRPGWNFLKFRRTTRMGEIWFTEYEPMNAAHAELRTKAKPMPTSFHANTCRHLVGLRFEVTTQGRNYFEGVLGRSIRSRSIALAGGVVLHLEPAKRNRFSAAILQAANFKKFCQVASPDEISTLGGRPAAIIKNPAGAWDIMVTG